jgi:hypothetical protein
MQTIIKVDGNFAFTLWNTPIIIVPVFSEQQQQQQQQQQHCLSIITILAGQIKRSFLRTAIGGNIFY